MNGVVASYVENQKQLSNVQGRRFKVRRPAAGQPPDAVERDYRQHLFKIIDLIQEQIRQELDPQLDRIARVAQDAEDSARLDVEDIESAITKAGNTIRLRIDNRILRDLEEKVTEYRGATSLHQRRELRRQIRKMIGLDAFPDGGSKEQAILDAFLRENVKLIKSLAGDYVEQVEQIVRRGVQTGDRANVMREKIQARWGVTRSRAMLIARDQTNKLHGALTRVRQTSLGIEKYIWRTSRDERVRESHLVKEGKVFSWDDPPADTGHPGQDYQCRCTAEPYIEEEPPPKENRQKVIAEVRAKRKRLKKAIGRVGPARQR